MSRGEKTGKLNKELVSEARRRYDSGETVKDLARQYEVAGSTMRNALVGITWRDAEYKPVKLRPKMRGEDNPRARLDADTVVKIRLEYIRGMQIRDLAEKYSVTYAIVYHVVMNNNWKHVPSTIELSKMQNKEKREAGRAAP